MIPRKTTRKRALKKLQQWRTPKGSKRFWRQVLFYVRCHRVSLQGLMEVAEKDSQRTKRGKGGRKKCRFTFSTHFMIFHLFKKRGSSEDFKYELAKATKLETLTIISILLDLGLKLQASNHSFFLQDTFRRATAEIVVHFTHFCKPEKTFLRFRIDLVSCVKADASLSLKTTELQGLSVDIWGDICEIGGVEFTRLAFRLLDVNISVQSALSVFRFAGKSILF